MSKVESSAVLANKNPIERETLSELGYIDSHFYDLEQYNESISERSPANKYYVKEIGFISKMVCFLTKNDVIREGRSFIHEMYAFRSCGKAIPQVHSFNLGSSG
jgi:hypothetical protein